MNLQKLKQGDELAWFAAGAELIPLARAAVAWQCPGLSPDFVEDVALRAFREIVEKIETYATDEDLRGGLFDCAKKRAIDFIRKQEAKKNLVANAANLDSAAGGPLSDPTDVPTETRAIHAELRSIAADLLSKLDPKDAELLRQRYLLQLSDAEIAERHGWGVSSVSARVSQALKRARTLLSSDERLREICQRE